MAELVPIPFGKLLKRIHYEYTRNSSIFDLPSRKFYRPNPECDLSVSFCGNTAANPVGPAAGPHTQMAQNIVLSWLAGARMLELKTVQINDRLQLSRPCIDITTVGYNTEWSQELLLDESLREYVKASMIIEILQEWFSTSGFRFQGNQAPLETKNVNTDTVFDLSVGYDLAGIQSTQIRSWLTSMRNATALIEEYRKQIPDEFAAYRKLNFKTEIGNSITLSTFHGTPANEIERICEFLLAEMDFHVIVKMNPPMLGKQRLEHLLFEKLGYTNVEVNPKAYEVNITYSDAVDVVKRLQSVASKNDKTIGVKFGNTLEVINKGDFLKEKMEYLSGQPLHILHLALVNDWRESFGAEFPISFSAGIDANNFADCVSLGLIPITTCTDLLRPGGFGRLPLYLTNLERKMKEIGAKTINEFIIKSGNDYGLPITDEKKNSAISNPKSVISSAIQKNTKEILARSIVNPRYHFNSNNKPPRKIGSHLVLWDCISCDKCIPVCPNDANFYFEIEPVEILYHNIELSNGTWRSIEGGMFTVKDGHQIANFADACNECGNCDVFCPEDGGPYIEKPRFFGSLEQWRKWNTLSGFFLQKSDAGTTLYGRFKDKEFILEADEDFLYCTFDTPDGIIAIDWKTSNIVSAKNKTEGKIVIDLSYFYAMKTLLSGMLHSKNIHFVNVGLVE